MLSSLHEIASIFMGIEFSYENEASKCKNVLLVGNGFDLALGQKTKYSDFLLYLILIYSVYIALDEPDELDIKKINIEDIEKGFESYPDLNFFLEIFKVRISKSPLKKEYISNLLEENRFTNHFLSMLLQEELHNSDALTEEVSLGHIGCFNATKHYIDELFYDSNAESQNKIIKIGFVLDKFKKIYESDQSSALSINGWLDVERFIEYLVLKESDVLQNKFYPTSLFRVNKGFLGNLRGADIKNDSSIARIYYNYLQIFTEEFCKYLTSQFDYIKSKNDITFFVEDEIYRESLSHVKYNYLQNLIFSSRNGFTNLLRDGIKGIDFIHQINAIIDFNYSLTTRILEKNITEETDFEEKPLLGEYVGITKVNGSCQNDGYGSTAIFGYTRKENKINSSDLNIEAFKFEKQTQRILKGVKRLDIEKIEKGGFNLIIFGFSCAPADADVLKPLLTSSELKVAVVLCHTENEMLSIYKNLTDILGEQNINHLLRQTKDFSQRLFLVVNRTTS